MNIVMIGYRGSGKTSVAQRLADAIECQLFDTDEWIVRDAGMSIAEIFQHEGEAGFRRREREAIRAAVSAADRIISVGGGAVESPENRRDLGDYGTVVWLDAEPETLWKRIRNDRRSESNRPDLGEGGLSEVRTVLARRRSSYDALADVRVDTTELDIDAVVELVIERLGRKPQ